ncbi:MAG: OmpA family protein [Bacteroidota bacterium]
MKFRGFMLFMLLGASIGVAGQYSKEFKRVFFEAGSLYQVGFYDEAFSRYKNLLSLDPGNSNILFHCGACCLKIPGNEKQAVTFFEEAIPGVTPEYKDNSHKESGAPVLTYFMLGKAFHLNNGFSSAIENYERYLDAGVDEDPLQLEYARLQVEACIRGEKVVQQAPAFEFQSVLDQFDDDLPSCNNPVISGDGNRLIFLVDYPNDKKIMITERNGDYWTRPKVINSEIGLVGETYPVSLSYDGLDLYVAHQFYSHADIFVSRFDEGRWSGAEALGQNINGRTSETHASISKDGKTLYFVSDARGGQGSYDIYVSRLDEKGEWGLSENLGPVINTAYEEHTPFISSNDSILFFSSQGHNTIGGSDVFWSDLGPDGKWSTPKNLGYPVNTSADNTFFNPGWNELDGVYAVQREGDPGSNTINMVLDLDPVEELTEGIPPEELLTSQPVKTKSGSAEEQVATTARLPVSSEGTADMTADMNREQQLRAAMESPAGIGEVTGSANNTSYQSGSISAPQGVAPVSRDITSGVTPVATPVVTPAASAGTPGVTPVAIPAATPAVATVTTHDATPGSAPSPQDITPSPQGVTPTNQEVSQPPTVYQTIEPEETDEIHEILNRGVEKEQLVAGSPSIVSDLPPATASTQPVAATSTRSTPSAGATRLETSVPFEYNEFELSMAAMLEVEKLADLMQTYPEITVRLTGHADATGPEAYNLLLSHQRVDQIFRYLEMRGIDQARVSMEGKGEKAPVARNSFPDGKDAPLGRYLNRQVTVTVESPEPINFIEPFGVQPLAGFYVPASLKPGPDTESTENSSYWFTIQLLATKAKFQSSRFAKLEDVREYRCKDGLYRYTVSAYRTFGEAKHALDKLQDSDYPDAFIQTVEWYDRATGQ